MRTTFLKITWVVSFIVFCFSTSPAQQSEVSDEDKQQIVRAVIKKELERQSFELLSLHANQELLLSSYGIETLDLEKIASDFRVKIVNPSELGHTYRSPSIDYLVIRDIRTDSGRIIVTAARVKEQSPGCFSGRRTRCEKSVVYEVHYAEGESGVYIISGPRANVDLLGDSTWGDCDEVFGPLIRRPSPSSMFID